MYLLDRGNFIYLNTSGVIPATHSVYSLNLVLFLLVLFSFRFSYVYDAFLFVGYLYFLIGSLFFSLFCSRIINSGIEAFLASFVATDSPLWIAPLVSMAEGISYGVRPVVLLLRPFINISIGVFLFTAIAESCGNYFIFFMCAIGISFYEIFVLLVHWYIVVSILSFSMNH